MQLSVIVCTMDYAKALNLVDQVERIIPDSSRFNPLDDRCLVIKQGCAFFRGEGCQKRLKKRKRTIEKYKKLSK